MNDDECHQRRTRHREDGVDNGLMGMLTESDLATQVAPDARQNHDISFATLHIQ